ncbi:hypothetical protein RchiOBHm_Chr7g0215881 [Rosa chinensis]|uniref:F-box domain-containing protein n=1 Tax=Rosa chinensis TaxID=74649 RepID=A0A2P6PBK4_ROSCH|nr:hypothetical protein RchiOBHm_Chr7g0215881 [Rosa chinensis]
MEDEQIRRYGDLETYCLSNVLSTVGMESLLRTVHFICKLWYNISLNPLSFQNLSFPDFMSCLLFTATNNYEETPPNFDSFYDKFID